MSCAHPKRRQQRCPLSPLEKGIEHQRTNYNPAPSLFSTLYTPMCVVWARVRVYLTTSRENFCAGRPKNHPIAAGENAGDTLTGFIYERVLRSVSAL